ncbi:MAG: TetR/AcrR family transcriptional regulator [Acidimicrobiia bacterium]|nr:TetR/AcrR family transcriptional regulator [Acidimicrobiia bacterium]
MPDVVKDVEEVARRRWRGVEPDARRAARRQRLLDAAFDLLGTDGLTATTVRGVCARAGLHTRYFYESFADVDALVVALFDQLAVEAHTRAEAAGEAAGDEPGAELRAGLRAIADYFDEDPRRLRVLVIEGAGNEALNRRRVWVLHRVAQRAAVAASEKRGPGDERRLRVAAHFAAGGLAELLSAWVDGTLEISADELIDDAVELIMALDDNRSGD